MNNPRQGTLFPVEPCNYVSSKGEAFFSCLVQQPDGKKVQTSYPVEHLGFVLRNLDTNLDTWISQAVFHLPNRRLVNLKSISVAFVDVDCYNKPWAKGLTPEEMCSKFRQFCKEMGVWEPSLILFSGRGLQVKWLFESPVPRMALPRWTILERWIVDTFLEYGADPKAKDASRVLRVERTINTKSNEYCRLLYESKINPKEIRRYDFETMFREVCPVSREQCRQNKLKRKEKRARREEQYKRSTEFNIATLYWNRLEDLRLLCMLRGGVKEGHRMTMLFHMTICLAFCGMIEPKTFFHEMYSLANQLDANWRVSKSEVSTLYVRLKEMQRGVTYEFNGRRYPAMYTPKTRTVIEQLEITPDEQKLMRCLIGPEEKESRRSKRRRAEGVVSREEYENHASARRDVVIDLAKSGEMIKTIADKVQMSTRHVRRLLVNYSTKKIKPSQARRMRALQLSAEGKSNTEIAKIMNMSRRQIFNYLK